MSLDTSQPLFEIQDVNSSSNELSLQQKLVKCMSDYKTLYNMVLCIVIIILIIAIMKKSNNSDSTTSGMSKAGIKYQPTTIRFHSLNPFVRY